MPGVMPQHRRPGAGSRHQGCRTPSRTEATRALMAVLTIPETDLTTWAGAMLTLAAADDRTLRRVHKRVLMSPSWDPETLKAVDWVLWNRVPAWRAEGGEGITAMGRRSNVLVRKRPYQADNNR